MLGWIVRLGALGAGDGGFGFLVAFAGAFGGALVPVLLAFGEGDFALDAAVLEIKFDGDECVAFLLRQTLEFFDLFFVEQEFAGAQGFVVHGVAVGERSDVGVEQEGLAILEEAVGVFEIGFAFADGLDLGTTEGDATLEAVGEEVVEAGGAVEGSIALAGGDGVAVFGLDCRLGGCGGGGRVGGERGILEAGTRD